MRRLAAVGAVLVAAGALGGWALASSLFYSPPRTIVQFGYVKSIVPSGKAYELRLDPAHWLGGLTAQRAAAEDGSEVDNDYYIVNPDHRLLTYRLPASASATVLVTSAGGIRSQKVSIAELAQIVKGRNPRGRALLEHGSRRSLGYWVKTATDTARSIDQQYQP